jgi:hypothetical protein
MQSTKRHLTRRRRGAVALLTGSALALAVPPCSRGDLEEKKDKIDFTDDAHDEVLAFNKRSPMPPRTSSTPAKFAAQANPRGAARTGAHRRRGSGGHQELTCHLRGAGAERRLATGAAGGTREQRGRFRAAGLSDGSVRRVEMVLDAQNPSDFTERCAIRR